MKKWSAWALLIVSLAGCGPDNKALDRERDDIRDRINESTKDYPLASGMYVGTWISRLGNSHPAVLQVFVEKVLKPLPPTNEYVEVPTLRASFWVYKERAEDTYFPLASFDGGSYSSTTHELLLGRQSGGGGSSLATSESQAYVMGTQQYFVGTLVDGHLRGEAYLNGYKTTFEGERRVARGHRAVVRGSKRAARGNQEFIRGNQK